METYSVTFCQLASRAAAKLEFDIKCYGSWLIYGMMCGAQNELLCCDAQLVINIEQIKQAIRSAHSKKSHKRQFCSSNACY